MRRPSPLRPKRSTKCTNPDSQSTSNKAKGACNTTTHSIKLTNRSTETRKKTTETEFVVISSSHRTGNSGSSETEESTASTPPKGKGNKVGKKLSATERKPTKSKIAGKVGSTSEPPKPTESKQWTGTLDGNQYARIKRNLFCQPEEEDDCDFYLNYHPSSIIGYEGFDDMGTTIPEWMPMTFRPTRAMSLNRICASTAAYIFMCDNDGQHGHEVLVRSTSGVYGDRAALKSLMPTEPMDQQVINLVVARCNWFIEKSRCRSVWYFPAEFAQYALDGNYSAEYVTTIYKDKFMKTSIVGKIFIPMNDEGQHWYLVAVDFNERKVYWLDSLPCDARYHFRRHAILRVMIFLEGLLLGDSFVNLVPNICHNLITNFPIVQPHRLKRQRHGSNDCGVWVAKWMIECPFNDLYDTVTVVTATRMKLAIFLCQSWNNCIVNDLVTKAAHYWDDKNKQRKALIKV